ncbi:UDP-N-acetylglucosamine 4-epimerase [Sphingobacterium sp. CZ-UAM]|uniref:NAD-dependent epimerase/dehydratase family protein n=1 Tax=Sphingobacterium sp. CZ-UAM TaxID=1933868 RepID=UPI0009864D08|nr:NAD-dependent epimerase/dehydratase family protein [Sphingobacterium sp. CZ-UAM]OOG19707.1 UDP-N-acetylglucosamine 4-epimerase [Sphingobacterium sp. CZ-UAM]
MKITIIGGSGFVGTHLIEHFQKLNLYELLNIDKNPSEHFPSITKIGNVMELELLSQQLKGTDVVVLLAAEHRDDVSPVSLYYDINVKGMENTLAAMELNGIKRLLFVSSVAIYGLDKDNPNENSAVDPFNHYGISKWKAELLLQDWYTKHADWNINIVRPSVIFGEGNRGNVYNLFHQIASGKFMMIGKGTNKKSMAYIGNVVAFLAFLIREQSEGYQVYNYVDKPDFNTNDLVALTGKTLNKHIPTVHIPYWLGMLGGYGFDVLAFLSRKKLSISSVRVKKFCAVTIYDSSKMMQSSFVPPFSLEEGLRRMLEKEFLNHG